MGLKSVALEYDVRIPFKSVAIQCSQDGVGRARLFSGRIDILDAQQPAPLAGFCFQIAGGRCNQRAEVEWARGRRREPADVRGWFAGHHQRSGLTVPIVPIAELSFGEFAALLRFEAKRCNRARFQSFQPDLFAGLVAKTVTALVKAD